jgi:hypothetical protein
MQQHVAEVAAAAAYADATGKQMGNGGGLIVGMSTMGMPGSMGVVMVLGIITTNHGFFYQKNPPYGFFLAPCPT